MEYWKRDVILSVVLIIISIILIIYSYASIDPPFAQGLASSGSYVRMWLSMIIIFSFLLLSKSILVKNKDKIKEKIFSDTVIFTIIILFLYIFIMSVLGYYLSTILFLFLIVFYYSHYPFKNLFNDKKLLMISIIKILIFSFVVTFIIEFIFVNMLHTILPKAKFF